MRDLLIASIVFGLLPFVLKRPFWGILLMAWLGYMNAHRLCYGFMLSFPVVYTVVLFTLVGMLVSREAKRIIWSREIIVIVMLVLWMGITSVAAFYPGMALEQYIKIIKIQILTFMTLMLLTSRERVHQFVWVVALSLAFYGVKGGLFTIAHGGAYRVEGPQGTFIGGNNELALALVMTIPLLRYLHLQEKRHLVKLGLMGAMFLTAISAIGSQSRGALLALSITGLIFWAKGRNKLVSGIFLVITAAVVLSIMPAAWYERMDTIKTYEQDASAKGRINAWWVAWNVARDRFLGGGFEMFQGPVFAVYAPAPEDVHDVHSIYFEMIGEHGFFGFFLFMLMLFFAWRTCSATIKRCKKLPEQRWAVDLCAMLQVSMVAYMVGGAFLGLANFDYIYHLVALTVVANALTRPSVKGVPAHAQVPLAAGQDGSGAKPADHLGVPKRNTPTHLAPGRGSTA